jgi:transcriptional regulator with XRE-family HTH domain
MTPAKLRVIGRLLYGRRWQTPLAYAVGVHPRTVTRWERGDTAMPEDLPERLRRAAELAVERSQHALGVVDELL